MNEGSLSMKDFIQQNFEEFLILRGNTSELTLINKVGKLLTRINRIYPENTDNQNTKEIQCNSIIRFDTANDLDQFYDLGKIIQDYKRTNLPFQWVNSIYNQNKNFEKLVKDYKLKHVYDYAGVAASCDRVSAKPKKPKGLSIVAITTVDQFDEWIIPISNVYKL